MPNLFGQSYTREELCQRIGAMEQVAGVRPCVLTDGRAAGARAADFWTGSGFEFTVLLDRALDISMARWQGRSLCWRSATGDVHPAYYEPEGLGWLRGFAGGLVTTCGLTQVGSLTPTTGSVGAARPHCQPPAENVHLDAEWDGDDYVLWASGKVRQARVFGGICFCIAKCSPAWERTDCGYDTVENVGYQPTEHQLLYHVNIGFPVVEEGAS